MVEKEFASLPSRRSPHFSCQTSTICRSERFCFSKMDGHRCVETNGTSKTLSAERTVLRSCSRTGESWTSSVHVLVRATPRGCSPKCPIDYTVALEFAATLPAQLPSLRDLKTTDGVFVSLHKSSCQQNDTPGMRPSGQGFFKVRTPHWRPGN